MDRRVSWLLRITFIVSLVVLFSAGACLAVEGSVIDDDSVDADDDSGQEDDDSALSHDMDADGWLDDQDCDDADPSVHPFAIELPLDGVDQNCDGLDHCLDLNCDSHPDIVFSNSTDGVHGDVHSVVYWGSAGGFSEQSRTELAGWNATWNTAADLDGDGYLDVVLSNHHNGEEHAIDSYVYWGGPDGVSPIRRTELPTAGAKGVTAADLDGDGRVDLVFSNGFDGETHRIDSYVYWGTAGGFSIDDRTDLPTHGAAGNAVADLDGDGYLDIVFANHHDDFMSGIDSTVYWGGADGYSEARVTGLPTSMALGVSIADLDGDGHLDLVFSNNHDGETHNTDSVVYWGGPDGFDSEVRTLLPTSGAVGNEVADLDGDGFPDLVFANHHDDETDAVASIVYWGTAGGFDEQQTTRLPTLSARGVAAGDLNLDGFVDLVFANHTDGATNHVPSHLYWGSAEGFSESDVRLFSTVGAVGVSVAGASTGR